MWAKRTSIRFLGILFLISSVYFAGCDIYKSEESHISGIDKTVCEQFSDSVFTPIRSALLTEYYPDMYDAQVSSVMPGLLDSLLKDSIFVEQNTEKAYELTLGGNDTTYLGVKNAAGTLTLFATDVVKVNLLKQDGKSIKLTDDVMPLSTISDCTELTKGGVIEPIIKLRLAYEIDTQSNVLIQIIKVEQTKSSTFKLSLQ